LHPPKFVISFPYNCLLAPNSVVLVASRLFSHVYFSTSQINLNLTFSVLLLVHVTPSDEATCRGAPPLKDHIRDAPLLSFALPLSPTIPTTKCPCPVPGARFYMLIPLGYLRRNGRSEHSLRLHPMRRQARGANPVSHSLSFLLALKFILCRAPIQ
jgi:hypothetical protein